LAQALVAILGLALDCTFFTRKEKFSGLKKVFFRQKRGLILEEQLSKQQR
jgi:hypothetical protein